MNPTSPTPPIIAPPLQKRGRSLWFKIGAICALVLLLHIPLWLTQGVLDERKALEHTAVEEISGIWGRSQLVNGPVLEVPYEYTAWQQRTKLIDGRSVTVTEPVKTASLAYFLPESLTIKGDVDPEIRRRGIYDTVVYSARLRVEAAFSPDFEAANIVYESIDWTKARLLAGVSDLRGLRSVGPLTVKDREGAQPFEVTDGATPAFMPLAAKAGLTTTPKNLVVAFDLSLQGSEGITFVPLGKVTTVGLQSSWANPSFSGAYLPTARTVGADGFKADWTVSHFSRALPQAWTSRTTETTQMSAKMEQAGFGATFARPVDAYRLVERAQKYGILFFVLIFSVFFLFEVTSPLRIHPLQYALVGGGLCLFFLGFLALSELMGAGRAYGLAAGACTLLITLYAWSFLKTGSRTLVIAGGLGATYAYLYFMLKSQDYALIAGVIALFAVLSLVMFFTRRINWYGTE